MTFTELLQWVILQITSSFSLTKITQPCIPEGKYKEIINCVSRHYDVDVDCTSTQRSQTVITDLFYWAFTQCNTLKCLFTFLSYKIRLFVSLWSYLVFRCLCIIWCKNKEETNNTVLPRTEVSLSTQEIPWMHSVVILCLAEYNLTYLFTRIKGYEYLFCTICILLHRNIHLNIE